MKFEVENYINEKEDVKTHLVTSRENAGIKSILIVFNEGEALIHARDVADIINKVVELGTKINKKYAAH